MLLRTKVSSAVSAVGLVLVALLYYVWIPSAEVNTRQILLSHANNKLGITSEVMIPLLLQNQYANIYESLDALLEADLEWLAIELHDEAGNLIYPLSPPPAISAKGELLRVSRDIKLSETLMGKLTLTSDISVSLAAFHEHYVKLLGMSVLGLFFAMLSIMLILDRFVRKPVEALTFAAEQLSKGKYMATLPTNTRDEIGTLVGAFQNMRDTIRDNENALRTAHEELQAHNKNLESKVQERTAELEQTDLESRMNAYELRQLIDTANAPIFGIDAAGLVNEWNQKAEFLTGYAKIDVMGKDLVAGFITEDFKVSVKEVLDKALKGEESANYEFPLYTVTGDRVDVLLNSTSRRDSNGNIVGVVGVGQDITESRKSQALVFQASKLSSLGEMATSVAHELNQPLNVIRMASGNSRRKILKSDFDPSYILKKLDRIEEQAARAAAIIDHMRMFGRESSGTATLIDPRTVIVNALDLMGQLLQLAGVEVVMEFPEKCSKVLGHIIEMEQVVLNILANARDAMKSKESDSKITLKVSEHENNVHIVCRDNGSGILTESLTRIFEPFYTTKEVGEGTGLGLSVSYGIMLEMGGKILAENWNDGAQFTIICPASRD
jgi:PAS domain S-box-containing protein